MKAMAAITAAAVLLCVQGLSTTREAGAFEIKRPRAVELEKEIAGIIWDRKNPDYVYVADGERTLKPHLAKNKESVTSRKLLGIAFADKTIRPYCGDKLLDAFRKSGFDMVPQQDSPYGGRQYVGEAAPSKKNDYINQAALYVTTEGKLISFIVRIAKPRDIGVQDFQADMLRQYGGLSFEHVRNDKLLELCDGLCFFVEEQAPHFSDPPFNDYKLLPLTQLPRGSALDYALYVLVGKTGCKIAWHDLDVRYAELREKYSRKQDHP